MIERTYDTRSGSIHYWVSEKQNPMDITLAFLPGLTADHRLFASQIKFFEGKRNVFVWDAPGHAASRPFVLDFDLAEKAKWLKEIFEEEEIQSPVIVGQSMGGYVGQMLMQKYPGLVKGYIAIDSAPLQRQYVTDWEIWMLRRVEPIYRIYPWKALLRDGAKGCAATPEGRALMETMMHTFDADPREYAALAGHGYRMLADAMDADLPYPIDCPAQLVCGEKDRAGSTKRYNREWHKRSGLPITWIPGAGHNSNTDRPDLINPLIENFILDLKRRG